MVLTKDTVLTITIALKSPFIGRYEDRLELTFENVLQRKQFLVRTDLRGVVGDRAIHEALAPTAPYQPPPQYGRRMKAIEIIQGPPSPETNPSPGFRKLPKAVIPPVLAALLSTGSVEDTAKFLEPVWVPSEFKTTTYAQRFRALLWAEEYKAE